MAEVQRRRPPLGLPPGSVRALLSLMVVSAVITETVRGHPLDVPLAESLMIVLALYFSARRVVNVSPDIREQLEQQGQIAPEQHPLYLPRFSIRVIILLSFAGAAAYLYQHGQLFTSEAFSSIGLVAAYFVGIILRPVGGLLLRWRFPQGLIDWFADLRALIVLGATGTLTACYWLDRHNVLPDWARSGTLDLLLFYFGAR